MAEPTAEKIAQLKAQFPDRSLHLVEAVDGDDTTTFIMTGPLREEYQKYLEEVTKAGDAKSKIDSINQTRAALERAVLAQVRWPDREECKRIFEQRPAMIDQFFDTLQAAAGSNVEVRSKKL